MGYENCCVKKRKANSGENYKALRYKGEVPFKKVNKYHFEGYLTLKSKALIIFTTRWLSFFDTTVPHNTIYFCKKKN